MSFPLWEAADGRGRSDFLTALYYRSNASQLWLFKTQVLLNRGGKERWVKKTGLITLMNSFSDA